MSNKKKILIIDDELAIAEMVTEFCSTLDLDSLVLEDGKKALETVLRYQPDLILLDLIMPDVSGLEILKILKNNKQTVSIPIFIVSVAIDSEEVSEALRLCQGTVSKPIHIKKLKEKINSILFPS